MVSTAQNSRRLLVYGEEDNPPPLHYSHLVCLCLTFELFFARVCYDLAGSYITLGRSFDGPSLPLVQHATDFANAAANTVADPFGAAVHGLKAPVSPDNTIIWMSASPGTEEVVLDKLNEAFPGVQVVGGSCADNAIMGEWSLFFRGGSVRSLGSIKRMEPKQEKEEAKELKEEQQKTEGRCGMGAVISIMQPGVRFLHHFLQPYVPLPQCQALVSDCDERVLSSLTDAAGEEHSVRSFV